MLYIWVQFESFFGPGRAALPIRAVMSSLRPFLQKWDLVTVPRVHQFIANSKNVQERIKRIYGRDSGLIYPPADVDFFQRPTSNVSRSTLDVESKTLDEYYLVVSALAPYKRVDVAIEACAQLGKKLVVIGEGQESQRLKRAAGPKTEFLGWRSNEELRSYYQSARALLFPGEEDFGIVPLEAMAAGCPVIALKKGGTLETVVENKTGIFFDSPTAESLAQAIRRFESMRLGAAAIQEHAQMFSRARCREAL